MDAVYPAWEEAGGGAMVHLVAGAALMLARLRPRALMRTEVRAPPLLAVAPKPELAVGVVEGDVEVTEKIVADDRIPTGI